MRITGTTVIEGAMLACAVFGTVGLASALPDEDPTPTPTETVTERVTETVEVPVPVLRAPTHPCHEDEAAIVQPYGLVCVPVDDLQPDRGLADRIIAESGRSAYWPSEYTIEPRNAHDTDPGE